MKLKELFSIHTVSISPMDTPKQLYQLYSLPAFDNNRTYERVCGEQIQSNKFIVPDKCILFNKLNVRFKRIWLINNKAPNKICSTEFLPLIVDEQKADFYYCYYLLQSPAITNYLTKQSTNTSGSHKRIDPDDFLNIDIWVPSITEQSRIGCFLFDIERKIINNSQVNANLESMIRQVYTFWFLQFDFPDTVCKPYKSSGGKMVWDNELKHEIPFGWKVLSINDLATTFRGVSYDASQVSDNKTEEHDTLVLRGNNIKNDHIVYDLDTAFISSRLVSPDQHIRRYDIIMTMSSGSKEHLGKCGMFHRESKHTFGAFLTKFTPKKQYAYYLFAFLTSDWFKAKIKSICNGTGINNLTNETFSQILLPVPPDNVLEAFNERVSSAFDTIGNNELQALFLQERSNSLLPLLMNGQVSVNQ